MKKLFLSSRYKKDFKRYQYNAQKLKALKEVLNMLQYEQPIPAEYQPHMLHGNYKGCMECHIQGDFLLIWVDPNSDIIELVRLGSHSELFGK
jgi:mRNA interferase YafQ